MFNEIKEATYEDALIVYNDLNEMDKLLVCPSGNFTNSSSLICHYVYQIKNNSVGFIEAYKYNGKSTNVAFIIYAVNPNYRKLGIATDLLNFIKNKLADKNYQKIVLRILKSNKASLAVAQNCGFKITTETSSDIHLEYSLQNYKKTIKRLIKRT